MKLCEMSSLWMAWLSWWAVERSMRTSVAVGVEA